MRLLAIAFIILLIFPVASHRDHSDIPRDGATLYYEGVYKTSDSTIYFNMSLLVSLNNDSYSIHYDFRGVKVTQEGNESLSKSGYFNASGANGAPITLGIIYLPIVYVAYTPHALIKTLNGYFESKLSLLNIASFDLSEKNLMMNYTYGEDYYVNAIVEIDTLVFTSYFYHRGSEEFSYELKSYENLRHYSIDEDDFSFEATWVIGLYDHFYSVSIEGYKIYQIGHMRLLYYHAKVYRGTLIEFNGLSGHINGIFLIPHLVIDPLYARGYRGMYKTPFFETEAFYNIYTIDDERLFLGVTPQGLIVSSVEMPRYQYSCVLSDLYAEDLASVRIIQNNSSVAKIEVNSTITGRIIVISSDEILLNESIDLRGEFYVNVSNKKPLEIIITDGSHGIYLVTKNLYAHFKPIIKAIAIEEEGIDLNVTLIDFVPIDIIRVYLNDTLVLDTPMAIYQELHLHLNASGNITIVAINPFLNSSSVLPIEPLKKPRLEVRYEISGCNVTFYVSIYDPLNSSTLYVYVDGSLKLEANVTMNYTFTLELRGSHVIKIESVDPIGLKASWEDEISVSCESSGNNGGGGNEGNAINEKNSAYTIVSLSIVLVILIAIVLFLRKRRFFQESHS